MSTDQNEIMTRIQNSLAELKAAEVADLFLSPFVNSELLNEATSEQGPAMWIVNRSDVYDDTLEKLKLHPIAAIADRAAEKLRSRHSSLVLLEPPELEGPVEEIPEYMVEDVLGHPLASFEAMVWFAKSTNEDQRATAALSLTRRVIEHPPNWSVNPAAKTELADIFGKMLIEDSSSYTRAYAARVPILSESIIEVSLAKEEHDLVRGRILQNPACGKKNLGYAMENFIHPINSAFSQRVLAMDSRLNPDQRAQILQKKSSTDFLAALIHEWYLGR